MSFVLTDTTTVTSNTPSLSSIVGIVGAGVAGLICARELVRMGFDVILFDKGRVPGGRSATRLAKSGFSYDHGAQYFTARDPRFQEVTADWLARRVVAEWHGRLVRIEGGAVFDTSPLPRYVGVPGMSAIAADLATGLHVQTGTRITAATRGPTGWTIMTDNAETFGPFDTLVVTVPAPQLQELLGSHPFGATAVHMTPCWAVMVAFESRVNVSWDGAFVHDSPLAWVARNSSKPGRSTETDCWVLHATPDWSAAHLEAAPDDVAKELVDAFSSAVAERLPAHCDLSAHRRRYSHGSTPDDRRVLFDCDSGLVVCGDWLAGGRIEGAFLAGIRAAEVICGRNDSV